jgi:hypothetical protein
VHGLGSLIEFEPPLGGPGVMQVRIVEIVHGRIRTERWEGCRAKWEAFDVGWGVGMNRAIAAGKDPGH